VLAVIFAPVAVLPPIRTQQLSATVVVLVVDDVAAAISLLSVCASGCPVCAAPVYDTDMPRNDLLDPDVIWTVLEPVAGAIRYHHELIELELVS
jgi:hypothetical protein